MKKINEMTQDEIYQALQQAKDEWEQSKPRSVERRQAAARIKNLTVWNGGYSPLKG